MSYLSEESDYTEPRITELGMQALQAYQRQHAIADRVLSYFHQYSAMMILLGLAVVAFRDTDVVKGMNRVIVLLIPIIAYGLFFVGNHASLRLIAKELQFLKGVAIAQTRLPLETNETGRLLLFHVVMALITVAIYVASWIYAIYLR